MHSNEELVFYNEHYGSLGRRAPHSPVLPGTYCNAKLPVSFPDELG
jgi:hypothetical protein